MQGDFWHFALSLVLSSDESEPRVYLILGVASNQSFILPIETCMFLGRQVSSANGQ